jgi:hypothetical protein
MAHRDEMQNAHDDLAFRNAMAELLEPELFEELSEVARMAGWDKLYTALRFCIAQGIDRQLTYAERRAERATQTYTIADGSTLVITDDPSKLVAMLPYTQAVNDAELS